MFTRIFLHKVEPAVSHPKCKDLVATQLGWGQPLKWNGVVGKLVSKASQAHPGGEKKVGEPVGPDAVHP